MSGERQRSANGSRRSMPPATQPRMLRVEFKGQPYDWFDLDEMSDVVRNQDFANTLRENIAHYFSVPFEWQAVFDEEGLLSTVVDFVRALQRIRPCLRVFDVREMLPEIREETEKSLANIRVEIARAQRMFRAAGGGDAESSGVEIEAPENSRFPPAKNAMEYVGGCSYHGRGHAPIHTGCGGASGGADSGHSPAAPPPPAQPPWACAPHPSSGTAQPVCGTVIRHETQFPSYQNSAGHGCIKVADSGNGSVATAVSGSSQMQCAPFVTVAGNSASNTVPVGPPQSMSCLSGQPPQWVDGYTGSHQGGGAAWGAQHMPGLGTPRNSSGCLSTPCAPPDPNARFMSRGASTPALRHHVDVGGHTDQRGKVDEVVEVILSKDTGGGARAQRFGFANVPTSDGRSLMVSWIDQGGLLAGWNHSCPERCVREGDRILAVNSARDDLEAMRAQLQLDTIRMLVGRCADAGGACGG
eukprot:TRINITY_DN37827_c0_g1_i1.p1 TRINITY_DN37827_c0_g1~~TRINITY_DN37827_c0_g1_i1.p1  ORF type:complete len:470 (-),score=58.96 TRINITY_DN37827_c0_g1_i1:229-1638(-)